METIRTDAVVIGSGPGGYVAAIRIGQLGKQVVCVERDQPGGICLNVGCIPSKALITASKQYEKTKHDETMGIFAKDVTLDVARLQTWKGEVVNKLTSGVKMLIKGAGGQLVSGTAKIVGKGKVEVTRADGQALLIECEHIVVATGSRPIQIPGFTFDKKRIIDSTDALSLDAIPAKLTVIGGGYIGLELGICYAKLGSKVTVVEGTAQLLPGNDPDLVQVVARKMKKLGVEVLLEAKAASWEEKGGQAVVKVETKTGVQEIAGDKILVTVGRRPNWENLGLEALGVKIEKGFVVVDKQQRTNVPGIYAIGDVASQPMLAHKASREGEVVAEVICGHKAEMDAVTIPAVIFVDPEIATVGLQEHEAIKAGRKVKVGKFSFAALGRSLAMAETDGFIKVIGDAETDELIGISAVGPEVTNIISEGALALEMGAFLQDIALTVHPHPTLGEGIMEAAKAALGECAHLVGGGQKKVTLGK